jgi:hypothetical protein
MHSLISHNISEPKRTPKPTQIIHLISSTVSNLQLMTPQLSSAKTCNPALNTYPTPTTTPEYLPPQQPEKRAPWHRHPLTSPSNALERAGKLSPRTFPNLDKMTRTVNSSKFMRSTSWDSCAESSWRDYFGKWFVLWYLWIGMRERIQGYEEFR